MTLSALIPGLGQIYNGVFGKGAMLLGLNLLITFLNKDLVKATMEERIAEDEKGVFFAYLIAGFFLTVFAMIDAKIGADRINRKSQEPEI